MKYITKIAVAVVAFFFAGLTAHADMKFGKYQSLQAAENDLAGKKERVFYPIEDGQTVTEAMRQKGLSLKEARAHDKKHEDQEYLVMWEESAGGSSGKKRIREQEQEPETRPEQEEAQPREEREEPRERRGFFGSLFGGIAAVFQPTAVVGGGGGWSGGNVGFVPDFVPPQRIFVDTWQQPCRPFVPVCRPVVPCRQDYWGGGGGWSGGRQVAAPPQRIVNDVRSNNSNFNHNNNRAVVNNSVRVQVPRAPTPTRPSSGPMFARNVQIRDLAGPSRSYGQSRSYPGRGRR